MTGLHIQLILGGPGLNLQVLRGDHDRPPSQGHHQGPQDQLDVQTSHEAQGAPRPHRSRKVIQGTWQGQALHPDQGWLPSRLLAETQQPQAPPEALKRSLEALTGEPGWSSFYFFWSAIFLLSLICKNTQVEKYSSVCFCQIPSK